MKTLYSIFAIILLCSSFVAGQDSLQVGTGKQAGAVLVIRGDTVLTLYSNLGPYVPEERVNAIHVRISSLLKDPRFNLDSLHVAYVEDAFDIRYGQRIIMTVTRKDALVLNKSYEEAAYFYLGKIKSYLSAERRSVKFIRVLIQIGLIFLIFGIGFLLFKAVDRIHLFLIRLVHRFKDRFLKGLKFRNYEFLSAEREEQLILWLLKVIRIALFIIILYLSLPFVFRVFPGTKTISDKLLLWLVTPVKTIFLGFVNYIPELLTILVIFFIFHYLVRFLRFISREIENEKLIIPGFYKDWAKPTFNIVRFIAYAFMFVMIFPYIPGSDSPIFKGVTVFLGLLISIGSSSAIANMVAGIVITYMRPFNIGERVKIGDTTGDVIEKTMLVTRIRTIKNEEVTIPNSNILTGHTINYSSSAKDHGLILHTTVTIGYDVRWQKVHELLLLAASKTEMVLTDPPPFVLQTSLDDNYVSYQLNAYTKNPDKAAVIYSEMHENIQDAFNEAGVEILSPKYRAVRDGNTMALPPDYLPDNYIRSSFSIQSDSRPK